MAQPSDCARHIALHKKAKCSLCGEPISAEYKPFCSRRCANRDLHRWLNGGYAIVGATTDEDDERQVYQESDTLPIEGAPIK